MFCKNCGTKLPDDSLFCTNCGEKIDNLVQNAQAAPEPRAFASTENPQTMPENRESAGETLDLTDEFSAPATEPVKTAEFTTAAEEPIKTAEFTTAAGDWADTAPMAAPTPNQSFTPQKKKSKTGLILGIGGGVMALILAIAIILTVSATKNSNDIPTFPGDATTEEQPYETEDDQVNTEGNTVSNILAFGLAATQGDTIYYVEVDDSSAENVIMSMDLDGSDREKIYTFEGNIYYLNVIGDQIFFNGDVSDDEGNLKESGVYCYDEEDEELSTLFTSPDFVYDLYVTENKMYFIAADSANSACRIYSANLDGTRLISLIQKDDELYYVAVVGDSIYYTYQDVLYRCNLEGKDSTEVYSASFLNSFCIDDNTIYLSEYTDDYRALISSIGYDGSNQTTLVESEDFRLFDYLNITNGTLYYADLTYDDDYENIISSTLYSANPDGSNRTELATADGEMIGISICGNWLFYYDSGSKKTVKIEI